MELTPLTEHQLLVFWTQLFVLLFAARALGALMRAVGQPTIIGELAAGVLVGPSVLGKLAPSMSEWLFPDDPVQSGMLLTVGWLGVFLLLIDIGFETDLDLIRSLGRAAALVTAGSLLLPLAAGAGLGAVLPGEFLGAADDRLVFVLFVSASISISALAVMAKVLGDLALTRRNVGQLMLATGMANDATGWLLLGLIAAFATSGSLSADHILVPIVGMAIFIVAAFTVGQRIIDGALRGLRRFDAGVSGSLTVAVVVALLAGALTQWIGVEAVLGGFIAGILLGRSKFQRSETRPYLEGLTAAFFAPIFFATAGLRVDVGLLSDTSTLAWTGAITAVAFGAKFLGAFVGARRSALPAREATALGIGLNSRGTLEIVIATVGLGLEVLNPASYTAILVMVLVTSTLAPPLLRLAVSNWPGTVEEQERLQKEEALARNVLVKPERILLPSRGGANSLLAARLLHLAWPDNVEATVLSVSPNGARPDVEGVVAALRGRPVERKHVTSDDPVEVVLRYAGLGYGVIGVGAFDRSEDGQLVSPLVDALIARSPLPMVIVRHAGGDTPKSFRRILVPAVGTVAARAAQEVAFNVAAHMRADTVLVHVATKPGAGEEAAAAVASDTGEQPAVQARPTRRRAVARLLRRTTPGPPSDKVPASARVVREAQERASKVGVDASATIREGTPPSEIVKVAKEMGVDLVFLGAKIHEVGGHPFLGHNVEQILEGLDATVVIVTTPRATSDG